MYERDMDVEDALHARPRPGHRNARRYRRVIKMHINPTGPDAREAESELQDTDRTRELRCERARARAGLSFSFEKEAPASGPNLEPDPERSDPAATC